MNGFVQSTAGPAPHGFASVEMIEMPGVDIDTATVFMGMASHRLLVFHGLDEE